jgi:hypothetical protein
MQDNKHLTHVESVDACHIYAEIAIGVIMLVNHPLAQSDCQLELGRRYVRSGRNSQKVRPKCATNNRQMRIYICCIHSSEKRSLNSMKSAWRRVLDPLCSIHYPYFSEDPTF